MICIDSQQNVLFDRNHLVQSQRYYFIPRKWYTCNNDYFNLTTDWNLHSVA